MLIPNKHNGYQAGIRRLHIGGGDDGTGDVAPVVTPPPARLPTAAPPPVYQTYGQGDRTGSLVQSGNSWRPSTLDYSRPIYDPNYADNITGYQDSSQFNQPIYQQQSANYATTNRLGVSQYGTPMTPESLVDSAYAGVGRFGVGTGTDQMDAVGRRNHINAFQTGQYTPQNFFQKFGASVQDYQRQNPNDRYTQYMQNQPGYMGGFTGFSGSNFMPQQKYNQYIDPDTGRHTGLADIPQMQGPFSYQQPMQQQMQSPFSYQQPMQQMQTPFSYQQPQQQYQQYQQYQPQQYQPQQMQQPMQRTSSGPSQAIVGRSSQMRGTPNVMRRAEGGIASLLDDDE